MTTVVTGHSSHRTAAKIGVSLLVTPVALAFGLVAYFVVGVIMGVALGGLSQSVMVIWLLASVGGTLAGAWALVWRLMR